GTGGGVVRQVLRKHLQCGHTYVVGRGYDQFISFNELNRIGSSYVCRVKDNSTYAVVDNRPLSPEEVAAGIISDQVVHLGMGSRPENRPDHLIRLVCIKTTPHEKRGKASGGSAGP